VKIEFAVERYQDAEGEITKYYPQHYAEHASNPEIPLDPDYEAYNRCAESGELHVVTARRCGELVGYHISMISTCLHYKTSKTAFTDIYYLRKDCRKGLVGVNFFKFVERSLSSLGVERIYTSTKTDSDKSAIFERLGYARKEIIFTKMLRGIS
jgi:hypothetical protein